MYSLCIYRDRSRLEQLEVLLSLIVNVLTFRRFLSSSQLRYCIKFEFECLELQHPTISIFGSRFLKIYLLELLFSKVPILRTPFNIQAGECSYLDGT